MMKKFAITVFFALCSSYLYTHAQVGINTTQPDPSSYLDVYGKAGGVLLPRLTTAERDNIAQPQTGLLIFNEEELSVQQNIGTPDAPKWYNFRSSLSISDPSWFYMPVTPIEVAEAKEYTFDLYAAYSDQYTGAVTPSGSSYAGLNIYPRESLEYIILGYDKEAFPSVAISSDGILTYTPDPTKLSEKTYLNIIFRIKK